MNCRISHLLLIGLIAPLGALADHDSSHRCNWAIAGYETNRFDDIGDGLINDTKTGLQWQKCDLGMSWSDELGYCHGYAQAEDWQDTLGSVALFNQQESNAGRNADWRLPNIKELASIVSMHCVSPAIDPTYFPQSSSVYWTSTPYLLGTVSAWIDNVVGDEYAAWSINFNTGRENPTPVIEFVRARLVRDISQ